MLDLINTAPPHHPVAQLFPMMAEPDFQLLLEDIRAHGLREPIWLDGEGRILDGRNRDRACRLIGVEPTYRVHDGDDPLAFVVSLNLHRRHLNESQRAMVAARLVTLRQGERTDLSPMGEKLSQRDTAQLLNVGKRSVERATRIRDTGAPILVRAVEEGDIAVRDAAGIVDLPIAEQEALVADIKAGKHKTLHRAAVARRREQRDTPPEDLPSEDDRCRLLVADVAELAEQLEPGSIDCIITDPPYPREYLPVFGDLARTAARVLKSGGSCLVMAGQSYLPEILAGMTPHLRYHWTVAYLTPGGQAVQLWERKVNTFWKPVLWFVNAEDGTGYGGDWVGDVARSEPNDNDKRFHHWGQSESGMADLVRRFTSAGDTILDPFLGGGTTGVVALNLNRLFVGSDLNEAVVERARVRLMTSLREMRHAG